MNTVTEWSTEFDVLYDNITSNKAPGLNEYEKSVFLTRAQEDVVRGHFNPKENQILEGIDDSIERQEDFRLLFVNSLLASTGSGDVDPRALKYVYPSDLMFAINEQVFCHTTSISGPIAATFAVRPLSYAEYNRLMAKPYKYPQKGVAWRLLNNVSTTTNAEIIARFPANTYPQYSIRYVKFPDPIILANISSYGTINGKNGSGTSGDPGPLTCKLPAHLHNEILVRAVELAKAVWESPTGK